MPKKYRYYGFILRIEKDLTREDIKTMRRALWREMRDVVMPDIHAQKINKPSNLKWGADYGT